MQLSKQAKNIKVNLLILLYYCYFLIHYMRDGCICIIFHLYFIIVFVISGGIVMVVFDSILIIL